MDAVYKVWQTLWIPLSWPFTVAIIMLCVIDLASHYYKEGRGHRQFTGLMTGLGILGTFFGVVVGLQDFDTSNIGRSIGPLLEGLKVSFATSVAGILASVFTEVIERTFPAKRGKLGDPVADSINQHMLDLSELIVAAKTANESVASNVAGLRTEMRDEAQAVRRVMESALEKLSKGATEEIIKALEDVIKDFNRNLTEQFGENFKQLNSACLQLVVWQQDFRESVVTATQAIGAAQAAISGCREQFEAALPKKQEFLEVVEGVGLSVKALAALNDRLAGISGQQEFVIAKLQESLVQMQNEVARTGEHVRSEAGAVSTKSQEMLGGFAQLSVKVEESRRGVEAMLLEHARGHKAVAENIDDVVRKLGSGNSELQGHLGQSLRQLETALTSLTADFGRAYRSYLDGMRKLTGAAS
jgi:hypothetical protein